MLCRDQYVHAQHVQNTVKHSVLYAVATMFGHYYEKFIVFSRV